jgi:AraC family transcriptional regulator of adaptative response/methylated-DNA-[protein]-cysteine methyltransferase
MKQMSSPVGTLIAASTPEGICLLEFADPQRLEPQMARARALFGDRMEGGAAHLEQLERELAAYFEGTLRSFTVPLVIEGTPFQRRVWELLIEIPYGETRSYEQLALDLGDAGAIRAVGRANGHNRIAIVVPCHRVINKNGELGGYGGGLRNKRFLLELERSGSRQPSLL